MNETVGQILNDFLEENKTCIIGLEEDITQLVLRVNQAAIADNWDKHYTNWYNSGLRDGLNRRKNEIIEMIEKLPKA